MILLTPISAIISKSPSSFVMVWMALSSQLLVDSRLCQSADYNFMHPALSWLVSLSFVYFAHRSLSSALWHLAFCQTAQSFF